MIDTYERVDLTGPWAGFGFQGHRFFTPEGHDLHPSDMTWWSLTCNLAREWQLMMAEARQGVLELEVLELGVAGNPCATRVSEIDLLQQQKIIYLRDVIRRRREERSAGDGHRFADRATVVRSTRGPRRSRRG